MMPLMLAELGEENIIKKVALCLGGLSRWFPQSAEI